MIEIIAYLMLRLILSKAQGCEDLWKAFKPCHVGIHWIALAQYSQMSTHMPGFQSLFSFFASFCIGQISHHQAAVNVQELRVNVQDRCHCEKNGFPPIRADHTLSRMSGWLGNLVKWSPVGGQGAPLGLVAILQFRWAINPLMLSLLSSNVQGPKDFWKPSKPCHVGIHWIALTEYSQMSTHMPGFQSFLRFFASFCTGQISHQQYKG